jgi:hypothetical protein
MAMDSRHIKLIQHAQSNMQAYLNEHAEDGIPLLLGSFHDANDYLVGGINAIPFKELRLYSAKFTISHHPYNVSIASANPKLTYGDQIANHAVIMSLRQHEVACLRSLIIRCVDNGITLNKISILSPCLSKNEFNEIKSNLGHSFNVIGTKIFTEDEAKEWREKQIPPIFDTTYFPSAIKVLTEHNAPYPNQKLK